MVRRERYDVIIVGAGAAGLAAAVAFRRRCAGSALLIDTNDEPGRKLLATGNGRCNLSNVDAPGHERTAEFFDSLGVLLAADESGRVYPLSRRADAVRDALVRECERLGCGFLLRTRVTGIARGDDDDFVVEAVRSEPRAGCAGSAKKGGDSQGGAKRDGVAAKRTAGGVRVAAERGGGVPRDGAEGGDSRVSFRAKQVIIATGGKARPEYGNLGDGYSFARALGIEVTPIRPALVPFVYADEVRSGPAALAGVRAAAKVALLTADGIVAEASGEVQFTEYGLSGICVFDLSRYYAGQQASVKIDFAPDHTEQDIAALIAEDRAAGLCGVVHPKIAAFIERRARALESVDGRGEKNAREEARPGAFAENAAALIKGFTVPVKSTKGWKDAQITAGGVAPAEVNEKYFESKAAPGLYFAGEVLDAAAPSGGYNLDHAWNTGLKAGRAAGAYCASYLDSKQG
jgi:predicted flavoprotein YhiN